MFFYRFLIFIFSPVFLGHIIWKAASNKQLRYFWQRLGFNYSALPENCLWFHCASVGEVNTLLPLLKKLHTKNQALNFIITSNTITGGKIVQQQKLAYLFHSYLPFDWFFSVRRFISTTRPIALYVLETEIWPNLFAACADKGIKICIINARLSSKTTTANNWIKSLLKSSLSKVENIYARSAQDAEAYELLGADKKIINTVGNLKLTTALNDEDKRNEITFSIEREYVLIASTHEDEEKQIYDIWKKLNRDELLIIAPRHPERGPSISRKLANDNIAARSKEQPITDETEIFLLDSVGELKNYFSNAKLVIMGGSFVPVGGHNILEPASFNSAIITGPYMENFKEEMELMLDNDAIVPVDSYQSLERELAMLLDDKDRRTALQNNTKQLAHDAEEILERYTALIL